MNERINTNNSPENHGHEHGEGSSSGPEHDPRAQVPRIWVGSLADYNNGTLHGEWIDAAQSAEGIYKEIKAMLAHSREPGAEEWGIFDYDNFGGMRIGEYESLETVSAVAKGIVEHGEPFVAWADHIGLEEAAQDAEAFTDAYIGHFASLEECGSQMWDEFGYTEALAGLPEDLRPYVSVDTEMWVRDMRLNGAIDYEEAHEGGVYVFWQ